MTEITPDSILEILRSSPQRFIDLDPVIQQYLRDLFFTSEEFTPKQRSLIDSWWLELDPQQASVIESLNIGRAYHAKPISVNGGTLILPAALLSDPAHYGHLFDVLSNCFFVEGQTIAPE